MNSVPSLGIPVGVLGATSLVGGPLLARLAADRCRVVACSRRLPDVVSHTGITWSRPGDRVETPVPHWIALCPPWGTVDAFDWVFQAGCTRLVALSSMSVLTKRGSPIAGERRVAARLSAAEDTLAASAARAGITLVLVRSTMIYDGRNDKNVARIAAFVRRFGWFPVCGEACGLRQPVHADDVASACIAAVTHDAPRPLYSVSGGEVLAFRDLVTRTCLSHGIQSRLIHVPPMAWHWATTVARLIGFGHMAPPGTGLRMEEDLSCDHEAAARDLGFRPRPFEPGPAFGHRADTTTPSEGAAS